MNDRGELSNPTQFVANWPVSAKAEGQVSFCLWLTGLSGAGKTTLAYAFERCLSQLGKRAFVIDGDIVRQGLSSDLGYDEASRSENVRRVAHVARMMVDTGLIVIVALISPRLRDRELARSCFRAGEFVEVFLDTPIAICEARDEKGLYRRARSGQCAKMVGIDLPYETPVSPEFHLSDKALSLQVAELVEGLERRNLIRVSA